MKYFLLEIKSAWSSVRPYKPGLWVLKYPLRNWIIFINQEVARFFSNLFWSVSFILLTICVLMLSIYLSFYASDILLDQFLQVTFTVLVAILSLFFTAAIFMATLSTSALKHASDENATYISVLHETENIFQKVYAKLGTELSEDDKWTFVQAHAAESVLDQGDYNAFREWAYTLNKDFTDDLNSSYKEWIKYPYDIATGVMSYRAYPIMAAISLLEDKYVLTEEDKKQISSKFFKTVSKLKSASSAYQISGASNYYSQSSLLGDNFKRVVCYGIGAIVAIALYKLISETNYDLIGAIDLKSLIITKISVVFLCIVSLSISGGYIMQFVNYFKWSIPEYTSPLYIYNDRPSDSSIDSPNSYQK